MLSIWPYILERRYTAPCGKRDSLDASVSHFTVKAFKTHLINNAVLARLAVTYELHRYADPPFPTEPGDTLSCPANMRKQLADMFEAYAGALLLEQRDVAEIWVKGVFGHFMRDAGAAVAQRTGRSIESMPIGLFEHSQSHVVASGSTYLFFLSQMQINLSLSQWLRCPISR